MDLQKITNYLKEEYIKQIYTELSKANQSEWLSSGLKALFQFSFQVFISLLNSYLNESGKFK